MDTNFGQVVLVKDINPNVTNGYYGGVYPQSSNPNSLVEFNDKLYFSVDNGESGDELFVKAEDREKLREVSYEYSNNLGEILKSLKITLFFSTYQAGKHRSCHCQE